jgi:hypothetical protein
MKAGLLVACALLVMPALAVAQETRRASVEAAQADKAAHLAPYQPHWSENLLQSVRQTLVEQPAGFYPYFDSVYNGGGFTLGGGYRAFTGDRTQLTVSGLYSLTGYKLVEAGAASPGHFHDRLDVRGSVLWRDATQVRFHGLGIDSAGDVNTGFRMQQAVIGGDVAARPHRWVRLGAATAYEGYTLKDPTGALDPIDQAFTPDAVPGLGISPTYVHTSVSAAVDWRPAADYARRGGLYRVARHRYADADDRYSFERLDAEVVQHIPVLRENWVFSVRGRLESTLDDADDVPYFLLPSLGSGSTLRGYGSFRFRDRHAVLLSGEWRWIPNRMALDMALFYDTGMVAPRLDAIALHSFVSDVGVGIRFHTPARTPLRVEVAKGAEGLRLVFAASSAF